MEIKYESGLPHQQKAVDAIVKVFENVQFQKSAQLYDNHTFDLTDGEIAENINSIQSQKENNVYAEYRKASNIQENTSLHLDIKMETGTGKTYVYTHTIYELHKRFGINKFIVAVPSLAIKEGAKSFMADADVKRHFCTGRAYETELNLFVLKAVQAKKGKRFFPSAVREFVNGSSQLTNQIYVLLLNSQLFTVGNMLTRDDYDNGPQGFHRPLDAIKATRPFLIIDEPHRFSRDQKAYSAIMEQIMPQCIIRFGATFPEIAIGKGKNKVIRKDYENLLYNLNACQAFNQGLVKGVEKEHFESPDKKAEKIKVIQINSKESVVFEYITINGKQSKTLYKNDSLAMLTPDMEGLNISVIGKDYVEFSNGQIKRKGEEFDVSAMAGSYQEAMMKLALDRHFETERKNFNQSQRIKTLALFFIDDIQSFRGDDKGENAWLRETFNRLLKDKIEKELKNDNSTEYAEFLQSSLENLNKCSAGYFAQDNSDSDEAVAKEVDDILRNKKQLLSFKNIDGDWNVRRFLFSKWTLKEGWDNPNVFTITKLRSSGSEISKIQEVGRGLRLPVDEYGNRQYGDFWLNYIVDFTEADFADKLTAEINGDISFENAMYISEEQLEMVAEKRNTNKTNLFIELLQNGYVDTEKKIIQEKITSFYEAYPEFKPAEGVNSTKVRNRNKQRPPLVTIRADKYKELRELWEKINQKYVICFKNELNDRIENDFHLQKGTFDYVVISSHRDRVQVSENNAYLACESDVQYAMYSKGIPYNQFLKRISKATSLPIRLIHDKVVEYFEKYPPYTQSYINESSMTNFVSQFNDWKIENVKGLLNYQQAHYSSKETALTDVNGKLCAEIAQGLVGISLENGSPSSKYLYEELAYDSELEKKNIMTDIDDVLVFGKIPRRSIAIPTVMDNYSPDFMYVVRRKDGKKELNIVIETKGVEGKSSLRKDEQLRIDCAEMFFKQLQVDGYEVKFRTQINNEEMKKIVEDLIE
ncbi:MAG: type III restriction-modification system endonuclease [Bacteroidales bacterium]|nr:type III restriction-modification system endonuclease [Bacteroidales bacterium]